MSKSKLSNETKKNNLKNDESNDSNNEIHEDTKIASKLSSGSKSELNQSSASMSPTKAYNSKLFTSACCKQFNIHDGPSCICSACRRPITQLRDDETLTISVKFNNELETNVSGDLQNSFRVKARRFATDPTYELCSIKCPKCNSYSRYARDPQKNLIFICSNPKCRNVFDN